MSAVGSGGAAKWFRDVWGRCRAHMDEVDRRTMAEWANGGRPPNAPQLQAQAGPPEPPPWPPGVPVEVGSYTVPLRVQLPLGVKPGDVVIYPVGPGTVMCDGVAWGSTASMASAMVPESLVHEYLEPPSTWEPGPPPPFLREYLKVGRDVQLGDRVPPPPRMQDSPQEPEDKPGPEPTPDQLLQDEHARLTARYEVLRDKVGDALAGETFEPTAEPPLGGDWSGCYSVEGNGKLAVPDGPARWTNGPRRPDVMRPMLKPQGSERDKVVMLLAAALRGHPYDEDAQECACGGQGVGDRPILQGRDAVDAWASHAAQAQVAQW